MYKERFVNSTRISEIYLDNPDVSIWGITEADLVKNGWSRSNEPLRLSDLDCTYCNGEGTHKSGREVVLYSRCRVCSGTGKQILPE